MVVGGGGGGGDAIRQESLKSASGFQLVRGEENEVVVSFINRDKNESLDSLEFTFDGGIISKYIEIYPTSLKSLGPGKEVKVTLRITSPTYIEIGKHKVKITLKALKGLTKYTETKKVILEIHELSGKEAEKLLKTTKNLIDKFNKSNDCEEIFCGPQISKPDLLNQLLNESLKAMKIFDYETVRDNFKIVKKIVNDALDAKKLIGELDVLILDSTKKGIDVSGTQRILKLAKLSFDREDFESAYSRAKEAQTTYALETKGEFAKLSYYLKQNKKEISLATLFLTLFSFGSYKLTKLQILRRKIKHLKLEEKIISELIKVVQVETFKKKHMSMDEYHQAVEQYEKRLSKTIEKLIELETQRAYALKFSSKKKKLNIEKDKIISLVKSLQKNYLIDGGLEINAYEMRLRSYNKRLGEVDEELASLEAKSALKGMKKIGLFSKELKEVESL